MTVSLRYRPTIPVYAISLRYEPTVSLSADAIGLHYQPIPLACGMSLRVQYGVPSTDQAHGNRRKRSGKMPC